MPRFLRAAGEPRSAVLVDAVHPRGRCWWCTWSTTCATSSMELIITIKEVLAVQLGNAASTQQMPPAYHHRNVRSHTVQPDRRLHSTSGWRLSADANGCVLDACSKAELGSSMLTACWRSAVCSVLTRVYAVVVVAAWEQVRLHRNLVSGV